MKYTSFFAVSLAALIAVPAVADSGFYAGALVGGTQTREQSAGSEFSLDTGATLGVFGGYAFGSIGRLGSVRAELEFSGRAAEVKGTSGTFEEDAAFANLFLDFDQLGTGKWVPYVGAGVGHGSLKYDNYRVGGAPALDGADDVWGGQAVVGIGYQINETMRIFSDYRYRKWDDAKVRSAGGRSYSVKNASHSLNLGVSYGF